MASIIFELSKFDDLGIDRILDKYVVPVLLEQKAFGAGVLYIVPSKRKVNQVEELLLNKLSGVVFANQVTTLDDLMATVFNHASTDHKISSNLQSILIHHIIKRNEKALRGLGSLSGFPGTADEISELISELKLNGIDTPEKLIRRCRNIGRMDIDDSTLTDLLLIFKKYRELLNKGNDILGGRLIDTQDAVIEAVKAIEIKGFEYFFPWLKMIVIEGYYDFNALQQQFIRTIVQRIDKTIVVMELPEDPAIKMDVKKSVFSLSYETFEYYKNLAVDNEMIWTNVLDSGQESSDHLFLSLAHEIDNPINTKERIRLIKSETMKSEIERIAGDIKKRHIDYGLELEEVSVIFPRLEKYDLLVREVFNDCGIEFNIDAGSPLILSPISAVIMDLIEVIEKEFPRNAVYRLLTSQYVNAGKYAGEESELLSPAVLDSISREAMIAGGEKGEGIDTWIEKLKRLEKRTAWIIEHFNDSNEEINNIKLSSLKRKRSDINRWIGFLKKLELELKIVFVNSGEINPYEYIDRLIVLLEQLGIKERAYSEELNAVDAWEKIMEGIEECRTSFMLFESNVYMSIREINVLISTMIRSKKFYSKGRQRGVSIMSLMESRSINCNHVYLAGLVDDDIPRKSRIPFVFNINDRNKIGLRSIRLETSEDKFWLNRLIATAKDLTVSYPLWEGDAECLVSSFFKEIERVCDIEIVENDDREVITKQDYILKISEMINQKENKGIIEEYLKDGKKLGLADSSLSLMRNLKIAELRKSGNISEYEGNIEDTELKSTLKRLFIDGKHLFSASQIEMYAKCPFKYYCSKYVLGLNAPEDVEMEVSPLVTGSILHEILQEFYVNRVSEKGNEAEPVTENNYDESCSDMLRTANSKLSSLEYEGLFFERFKDNILAGLEHGSEATKRGLLAEYLKREIEYEILFKPIYFEAEFSGDENMEIAKGTLKAPFWICDTEHGKARFRGAIDRIDVYRNSDNKIYFIIDYKTGAPRNTDVTLRGLDFQLPLYILYLRDVIESTDEIAGAAYYHLKGEPKKRGLKSLFINEKYKKNKDGAGLISTRSKKGILQEDIFNEQMKVTKERISKIINAIISGKFNTTFVNEVDAGCSYCEFQNICRHDYKKMKIIRSKIKAEKPDEFYFPDWK